MSAYVLLFRSGPQPPSGSEMQKQMQRWEAWMTELAAAGSLKDAGYPVAPEGKLVQGPSKSVINGSFSRGTDVISGFMVINASDIDRAVALSHGCPIFESGGAVEIRPVLPTS